MTEKEARDIAYKELNYDENGNLYDREPRQILECVRKDENSYTFTYTIPDYDDFVNTIFVDTKYGDAYPSPL